MGKFKIIDAVNFEVNSGEVVVLLGEHGAGKTTLLDMITGNIPITSGDIYFNNKSIAEDLNNVR